MAQAAGPSFLEWLTRVGDALGFGCLLLALDRRVDEQGERRRSLGLHSEIDAVSRLPPAPPRPV